ncbi:hypothetical protein GCM10022237_27750 [Nocardioides ginsengisoli]|uniref:Type II toxin-antitoxin system Phd/YefM family antitoxin n=1 Tax=Nocardioides ginsengisoli TaxID=363868 RepID=A0ABW3W4R7_9ACTN
MTTSVDIREATTHLSRLLERMEAGEPITFVRAGKPVADLVPHLRTGIVFGTLALLSALDGRR